MRLLIAEDDPMYLQWLRLGLEGVGHEVSAAPDGPTALALLEQDRPDLCILDVNLPGLDGFQVAECIRVRTNPRWVPILFLSVRDQLADQLAGFQAGGDDYLTKPVDFDLLTAKIRAFQRVNTLQSALANHYDRVEDEHQLAQGLLERLSDTPGRQDTALKWMVMPLHRFSGDQLAAHRAEDGSFTVLLADAMGHGLVAAICLVPILKTFAELVPQGLPLGEVTRRMNQELRAVVPTGRFVAMLVARLHPKRRTVEVWNGGIPVCLLMGDSGQIVKAFDSEHPPLGVMPDVLFESEPACCTYAEGETCTLLGCSDGLTEACDRGGRPFDLPHILQAWREGPPSTSFERVLSGVFVHLEGQPVSDDLSLFAARCDGR